MVNLYNGGTKDFVKLWEIIHLKIWTHFSIRQTKLFWINLKHYSQTFLNDHLCKTTNSESAQANSGIIVTVWDNHLSNATSDHFFCLPKEK